ncbi:cyclopropane-fatty-acyl-phospholipid synthase family protein [Sphingomonas donggukensis]|uniref:Cyclopropane-fatty-acyl-phospholipid synthase family protein n=1 Tax=Sphingomonas donggukensis TaxID=2949093 RepID=A0ABY4TWR7_9SPHN|nr:cyclopropane-fatty-acyl-phospholipid synthase family protein [Sphingomonas donggukensis]URW76850.1 cyclopropane-fatty-acyl-phospholipid synthase family protein [Sphingomonas donggukensis]
MTAHMPNRGRRTVRIRPSRLARLFAPVAHAMLDRIDRGLAAGAIEATLPDGTARRLGGHADGPVAIVRLANWRALWKLASGGSAGWYEAWAAGDWSSPDPVPLFDLFMRNRVPLGRVARAGALTKQLRRLGHWLRRNTPARARANIAYHYDLGNDFYRPWLDAGMTYSSAMFPTPGMTLEAAQDAKLAAVLARTGVGPGDTVLEIGCGWGSFAEIAARVGVSVHGITLSTEQRDYAEARAAAAGLTNARFTITDYRDVAGTYDAVASIEMVEAVGREYWPAYLHAVAAALKPGGRAAIQLITIDDAIFDAYAGNVDFIQAYVFPGGMLVSEREFRALAAANGLAWRDRVGFGLDYAETLRMWRERFDEAAREGRLPPDFDRGFMDLWRYYLMYCEGGFRGGGIDVVQVTLVKDAA